MKEKLRFLERMAARGQIHFKDAPGEEAGGGNGGEGDEVVTPAIEGKPSNEPEPEPDPENDDDKGKPTENEIKLLKETMRRKKQIEALESELSSLKQLQAALGDLSADDIKAMVAEKSRRELEELESKKDYQAAIERVRSENQKVVEDVRSELAAVQSENAKLRSQIDEMTVGRSFSDSQYILEKTHMGPTVARATFGEYFELVDGEIVAYDKPRHAEDRTPLLDANGQPKGFEAAIEELVRKHPDAKRLLRSEQKPGAGSRTTTPTGQPDKSTKGLTGMDKIRLGLTTASKG